MAQFLPAIELVLNFEGGYVNDPRDPGGETNYGISKRQYPTLDIAALTPAEAQAIYCMDYWQPIQGAEIADQNVANNFLDFAVNAGVKRATQLMQQLVGATVDGKCGPKTLAAINAQDGALLNARYSLGRVRYYTSLVRENTARRAFLLGWIQRALDFEG